MNSLIGLTLEELRITAESLALPKFTAAQLARWIYKRRCGDFAKMTDISAAGREKLSESCEVGLQKPMRVSVSADGTKKYLFAVEGGHYVESVLIPDGDRLTLCISSQAGCRMGCKFCATGQMGFGRNLTAGEILNQLLSIDESEQVDNIVYMGMGEPLDNCAEVLRSIEILCADYGLAMSPGRITLSTVGRLEGLRELLDKSRCHVAVSVHHAVPAARAAIVPSENSNPLKSVVALLGQYDWTHRRRISFEYTMLRGVNDDPASASALAKLIGKLPCRVNLIPFHAAEGLKFEPSDAETIENFKAILEKNRITTTIRRSRGRDIDAACGMLSAKQKANT